MPEEKQFTIACPRCHTEYRVSTSLAGKKVTCKRCNETFTAAHKNSLLNQPPRIGKLAVKYNLITDQQFEEARAGINGRDQGDQNIFENILLEKGFLTEGQVEMLKRTDLFWKANQMSRRLGALAVEKGMITEMDLTAALEKQAALFKETQTVRYVKDILYEDGLLTKEEQDTLIAAMDGTSSEMAADVEDSAVSIEAVTQHYDLVIAEDRLCASLRSKTDKVPVVNPAAVHAFLKKNDIVHGIIDDEELRKILSEKKDTDAPAIIARGNPPEPGVDATIHYHFDTNRKIGTFGAGGSIDFKDKGEVPFVHEGDLLIEKVMPEPGKPGTDVYGNAIDPIPSSDVKILLGSGTYFSEDKLKVFAKSDGQPKISLGGKLSVVSDLVIKGDVDLKTGHVDFEGDVKVTGTIQSGFSVKASNVSAREIMGAKIIATGSVIATGGVIGATLKAQGEVKAKFIKNAKLSTFGDIIVQKEITDSTIDTSGACRLDRGKILSSEISAKQGIEALDIGTDLSAPCKLTVGVDDHIEAEIGGIQGAIGRREERLDKITLEISEIEKRQQVIHKKIADMAQVQDRSLVEMRPLEQEFDTLSPDNEEKRDELEAKIADLKKKAQEAEDTLGDFFDEQDELTQKSEKKQDQANEVADDIHELKHELEAIRHWAKSQKKAATVKIAGSVVQGTLIAGSHSRAMMKDTYRRVTIREVKNTDPDSAVEYEIKIQSK